VTALYAHASIDSSSGGHDRDEEGIPLVDLESDALTRLERLRGQDAIEAWNMWATRRGRLIRDVQY
jgi:hypothetical protein